jgi:hypothetical protein
MAEYRVLSGIGQIIIGVDIALRLLSQYVSARIMHLS